MSPLPERVEKAPDVVFREVGGEAVILDLASQRYFSLDPVGTRMWILLVELERPEAVRERLLAEYEVAPEDLQRDLEDLVGRLVEEGLMRAAPVPTYPGR